MIVDIPDEFDLEEVMDRLEKFPLQADWKKFMNQFQLISDGSGNRGKWKPMKKIFSLSACTEPK